MIRRGSALTDRLRTATLLRAGDRVEEKQRGRFRKFPGRITEEDVER